MIALGAKERTGDGGSGSEGGGCNGADKTMDEERMERMRPRYRRRWSNIV